MNTSNNTALRALVIAATATIAVTGTGVIAATSASAAPVNDCQNRIIIANQGSTDLDMTITTGADGSTYHKVVTGHGSWEQCGNFLGADDIVVKDASGVAFTGTYTYDGDWAKGTFTPATRMTYKWHTGTFGGFDFRV